MNTFLFGVLTTLATVIAIFFLKFWRGTQDRLFAFFAAAFFILGGHWLALVFIATARGNEHLLYEIRLLAFLVIIVGIVDKNRRRK
jgi:hypothetical protein